MGKAGREFIAGQLYEICFRAREGIPFASWQPMKLIIEAILARVQRDEKLTICHYIWMGNHPYRIPGRTFHRPTHRSQ
jgi:hypothetical protein